MPQSSRRDAYRVGWICPMEVELTAALQMLDEEHEMLLQDPTDTNVYTLGSINTQNIVIVGLPSPGNRFATHVISQMRRAFPSLRYALLVGIGGGVPVKTTHGIIRLGHVVVGIPTGIYPGVVQYDHGKFKTGLFERTGSLSPPPTALLSAAHTLHARRRIMDYDPVWSNLKRIRPQLNESYKFPGVENDHLYQPDYEHQVEGVSCEESHCQQEKRIERLLDEDAESRVVVHTGTIASGESVMKSAKQRNKLAGEHNVLCFETEAAGALIDFPCMVIRGISDYCDSHKNDVWHAYASAVAAAYARALICCLPKEEIKRPEMKTGRKADHQFRYFIVPPLDKRHFTGRETTLEQLQQRLFIQANTQKLALFGLSGIGKTQVALQFAHWVKKERPEFSVFWVPAYSLQSFEQECLRIVKEVGIQQRSDDANESAMELVHHYFSSNAAAGKWLFIVDNADDHDLFFTELYQFIPASENGITLLTTCTLQVAVIFATKDIVKLEKMTLDEGKAFLAKIVGEDLLCEESTTQLLEELHYLPLAITQAAFYVGVNDITISQYLELMHETEKDRADLASRGFRDCSRYLSKDNAITTTFIISFERIKNSDPDAAELLEFLAYIEPKAIPRSMLPTLKSEENTQFAIGILRSYAFLTRRDDGKVFDMHGLVQLSTWQWIEKAGHAQQAIQKVVRHMDECFPSDENYNYEKCRAYLPHAIQVIRRDKSKGISERYSLLIKVGDFVSTEGREKEALGFFEDASMWHESQHNDEEHPDRQFSDHALANAYRSSGQIKRAVQILERVVAARQRKTADKADRSLLAYQYALAMAYKSGRQIKLSLEYLNHVVEIQKGTLAKENPDLLSSQHALANAYRSDGQIKLAVQMLEHVVEIREKTLHEEDHDLLSSQQALAKSYKADGQIERAVEILQHVVTIRRRTLGDEAPFLLLSERALAKAYKSAGDIKLAVQRLEHVVKVHNERTLDKEDRDLLSAKHSLAMAYQSDGQIPRAVKMLEEVVAMYQKMLDKTLDEENPHLLSCQHALAKAYLLNKQIKEAMQTLEHVVMIRGNTLEEGDRRLLSSQRLLAMVYKSDGQVELAVQKLEHVVAVHKKVHGEGDPDGLASQKALAKAKRKLKKLKKLQAI